jgi:hypothetical protein
MAKMFYTMEETKSALAKSEEDIKQLAREGRLREFRDGARLMFKADQVEQIKAELAGGAEILGLGTDDEAPITLVDEPKSATGSAPGIAEPPPAKAPREPESPDIGLSGSLSAAAKAPSATGSGTGLGNLAGSGSGSGISSGGAARGGITIFDVDESQKVDPSAQTAISKSIQEQVSLESVGSGSGLLDLTRESDDTSLGAVFDELTPGAAARRPAPSTTVSAMETQAGSDIGMPAIDRTSRSGISGAVIYVEEADAVGAALGAASLVAALVVCFGAFVLGAVLLGYRPDILNDLQWEKNLKLYLLGAVAATALVFLVGFFLGRPGKQA